MTTLPISGSIKVAGDGWKPGKRTGETNLVLIDDPRGYRSLVTKVAPGPLGEIHAHDEIEQIYVIEGDFYDEDASYGAGDFVLRMPGTMHRAGSKNGCTMFIVYTPFVEGVA